MPMEHDEGYTELDSQHSKLVGLLTISTDFDNFVEDHDLNLPSLNLTTIDYLTNKIKSVTSSLKFKEILVMLDEYKAMAGRL